jgi:hypothetical protein
VQELPAQQRRGAGEGEHAPQEDQRDPVSHPLFNAPATSGFCAEFICFVKAKY